MSLQDGHRDRMKRRLRREGLEHFEEVYVLEVLLYYAIPRKDTKPLAYELLQRFGSLSGVLEAPQSELEKVPGVGEHVSTLLHLVTELERYRAVHRAAMDRVLPTVEMCCRYLVPHFMGRREEMVYILCLDGKCRLLCCEKLGQGSVNSAEVPIRKLVEVALRVNASAAVLAHNHPSGLAVPTAEDIQATVQVSAALEAVGVRLLDHIIVADGDYVSLADSKLFLPPEGM